jgi:hypothetical protein
MTFPGSMPCRLMLEPGARERCRLRTNRMLSRCQGVDREDRLLLLYGLVESRQKSPQKDLAAASRFSSLRLTTQPAMQHHSTTTALEVLSNIFPRLELGCLRHACPTRKRSALTSPSPG